jgi:mannose-6-phosphate isomerase-like protein (cupin superfamily)
MSHRVDVAHSHKTRGGEEERMEKGVVHIPPGEGASSLWVFGELLIHKIPSQQTGGAYSLFEVITHPRSGPPPHIHHREDESFYVLESEFELLSGEETLRVGAGFLLYVLKGTLHAHKNVGEGVGRMLLTQTPGGLYEQFFEGVGKPADGDGGPLVLEDQPDVANIVAIAARYGIEIPPPIAEETGLRNATKTS